MDAIRAATARFPHGIDIGWRAVPRPRGGKGWILALAALLLVAGSIVGTGLGDSMGWSLDSLRRGQTVSQPAPGVAAPASAGEVSSAESGGVASAQANGGAVGVGDTWDGAVAVDGGASSSAANISISANGGTAIADGSGGDGNLAFIDGPDADTSAGMTLASSQPAPAFDRKVIRNATLALTVEDVNAATGFVREAAAGVGGFVFSASTSYRGEQQFGQIVIHVPFTQFDAVMGQLRGTPTLLRIDSEATSSQDVTQEYVDVDARLRNLAATEQGLIVLMDKAANVGEVIKVFNQLANVRGEIETLQGRKNALTTLTDYSTITVNLAPKVVPAAPEGSAFERAVREAWQGSLALIGGVALGVVQVIVFLWWLVPLALSGYVLLRHWRGRRAVAPATPAAPSAGAPSGA